MDVLLVSPSLRSTQASAFASDALEGLSKALRAVGVKATVVVPMNDDVLASGLMLARRLTKIETPSGAKVVLHEGRLSNQADLAVLELPDGAPADSFASAVSAYAVVRGVSAVHFLGGSETGEGAVDAAAWNTATDTKLTHRYNPYRLWAKKQNQGVLAEELGMSPDAAHTMVMVCSDAASESAARELVQAALKSPCQFLVFAPESDVATVAAWYNELGDAARVLSERADDLVRRAMSSADLVVWARGTAMPVPFALRALRYAVVPVLPQVCAGSWSVSIDPAATSGNAVLCTGADGDTLGNALTRALALVASPSWEPLLRRVMTQETGWERHARALKRAFGPQPDSAALAAV